MAISQLPPAESSKTNPYYGLKRHIQQCMADKHSLLGIIVLLILAIDLTGLYVYLGLRIVLLNPIWIYLTIYAILFTLYAYASSRIAPKLGTQSMPVAIFIVIFFAIIFRLVALPAEPSLSTDMYRYVWDGRLTLHFINPYRYAPNAECLRYLRDGVWVNMEYKTFQTIYMPMSQYIFAICNALFHNNLIGYKFVYMLFDIGVIWSLYTILRRMGRSGIEVIWYAWCPLPITEISIAGHQDITGVFFLMLTLVLAQKNSNPWLIGLSLICSGMTKGFALMLIPLFVRNYDRRIIFSMLVGSLYLGMLLWVYLPNFLLGMRQYLDNVHVNSSFFHWTNLLLANITSYHYIITKNLSNLIIGSTALWAAWKPVKDYQDLLIKAFIVLAVTLMVVPTLFPWYLVWVLPFLALLGRRPSWAFVILTCQIGLLYTFYISIKTISWVRYLEYLPFYSVLTWEYLYWRLKTEPVSYFWRKYIHKGETKLDRAA